MSWVKETTTKLTKQEIAEQVLQIYIKSLQDHKSLKNILSEWCVLDYFGKIFYGSEKVASHLITNLLGSNYELSSLSINNTPTVLWKPITSTPDNLDEDLGISLISPLKFTFPSVTLTTPARYFTQPRKRTASEASVEDSTVHYKTCKTADYGEQSNSGEITDDGQQNMGFSLDSIEAVIGKDLRYLTAFGTIRYPKKVLPSMDLKRIKHHSLIALRGSFCQLSIGFKCEEHIISVTNCKIWTIKYSFSSRVTPRNLLKAFNEVDNS